MTPQELKNSILQLAIRGKLVEQCPEEGTAEELYRRIQAEKQALIKAGKIKKEKPLPEIAEEEKPFDIPESWKWVRLADVCSLISDGTHKTPNYVEKGVPFISVKDISSGVLDLSNTKFITEEEHYQLIQRCKPEQNDILICRIGTLGKALKINSLVEFSIFVSLGLIKLVSSAIADYVTLSINSGYGFSWIQKVKVGGGTHTYKINLDDLRQYPFPLPPLAEQKRIVAKIEELLPLIDRYEEAWTKLEDFNKRFPCDMQKSLLQMAIQGKLVEQRPEEGTGEELYQQIQAEKQALIKAGKIKKDKPLPEITDDEKPFDIPESWKWVRLINLCKSIADGDHQAPPQVTSGVPFIVISNLSSGRLDFANTRHVPQEYFQSLSKERIAENGDVLFTVTGSYGIPVKVECDEEFCFQRHMALLKPLIDVDFLLNVLKSPLVKSQCDACATGTAQKTVGLNSLKSIIMPLPPLAEQKRIVAKLEELLPLCERLK